MHRGVCKRWPVLPEIVPADMNVLFWLVFPILISGRGRMDERAPGVELPDTVKARYNLRLFSCSNTFWNHYGRYPLIPWRRKKAPLF